jgi:pimeloyl-ACP methyl ester carboxylesterase
LSDIIFFIYTKLLLQIMRADLGQWERPIREGGFDRSDIDSLLETLESNYLGWASTMAPAIMGAPGQPELAEELTNSFCRTDPDIAEEFARVTFLSDNRDDLWRITTPTLILQFSDDLIAPGSGRRVHAPSDSRQHAADDREWRPLPASKRAKCQYLCHRRVLGHLGALRARSWLTGAAAIARRDRLRPATIQRLQIFAGLIFKF